MGMKARVLMVLQEEEPLSFREIAERLDLVCNFGDVHDAPLISKALRQLHHERTVYLTTDRKYGLR